MEFEPSGGGDDTTSATPKFATGGDKCTLAEGGNTATFTLKDAVTTSTVYKLYDAATDGTLKATSDAVTSGTTVTFSGVTAGTYYMSATEGSKAESSRVAVTVKAYSAITTVTIDGDETLNKTMGDSAVTLTASTAPQTGGSVTWSSSNEAVATVSNSGEVTFVAVGKAVITATSTDNEEAKDSVTVNVKAANGAAFEASKLAKITKGAVKAGEEIAYNDTFTIIGHANMQTASNAATWSDPAYTSATVLSMGGQGKANAASVKFTISKESTVEIWWTEAGDDNRQITVLGSNGQSVTGATSTGDKTKNDPYYNKFTITPAAENSVYYVGSASSSTNIAKIVITEVTEQPEDKTLTGITVGKTQVDLKVGGTEAVTVAATPTDHNDTLKVESSAADIATAELKDGKVNITANGTKAGTAKITVSGTTATTVKAEITVNVSLKKMKNTSPEPQSKSFKPGQTLYAQVEVRDADTNEVIDATFEYAIVTNGQAGEYTSTRPSQTNYGTTTYMFKANATGYEEFTSVEARNITVTKANPVLSITAKPNRVKAAEAADRYTIITVNCDIDGADVTQIEVSGKNLTANQELLENRFVEQSDGVYKVSFPEPDVSEAEYVFTASFGGNTNYNAATDQTARVTVVNSTVVDRTYKLTYDAEAIKIKYTSDGSTDAAVLLGAGVEAEAIVPEGKEFDHWESADLNPTDADWATQNPTKFAMPGHDVELKVVFKDKTTEPEKPANKTQLAALLVTAREWAKFPVVADAADDVDKGEKWVTADEKADFDTAIIAAQAVSSNDKATQAQVDEAAKKLEEATDAFKKDFKDGTKSGGSSEPTTTTKVLDANTMTAGDTYKGGPDTTVADYFTIKWGDKGKVDASSATFEGDTYEGTQRIHMGGATKDLTGRVINFTTTGADATVKIWYKTGKSSTSPSARNIAVFKGSMDTIVGQSSHTADDEDKAFIATYTLADPATYSVGILGNTCFIYKIEVTDTTTTGGGDTSVVPDTAARTALKNAIADAKKAAEGVETSKTNGSEYPESVMWVTESAMAAYQEAIELAEAKANSARFDDEALTAAKTALESAKTIFVGAQRKGTKTESGSSSSGSSSSNVPSTGGGTTVKNEDGSKTTTKTDKATGTVTETTTWPNGDKQVVVTEKDGTKTETVTKKDGSKTETVTKPDGSTTTAVTDAKGIKTETAVTASGEVSAKVSLPKNVDKTVVTIPVKDATEGTVAVIVDSKGNETVIKTAVATENGLELLVTGNVSVKIKDNAKKFVDIADDYWAKGAVDFVSSREIFKGVYETVFAPAELVNRGMMATVLYRLADAKAEGSNNFFDVPDGTWYTDAVTWANRSGVVTGYADGTFGPADAVTREQMATMLFRYAKAMGMDISAKGDVSKFSDANDVSSWASEAMTWAVGVGLINGVADPATGTTLSPTKTATRAEVATIMQRMVKLMMK